jgi:hypothetical protein
MSHPPEALTSNAAPGYDLYGSPGTGRSQYEIQTCSLADFADRPNPHFDPGYSSSSSSEDIYYIEDDDGEDFCYGGW